MRVTRRGFVAALGGGAAVAAQTAGPAARFPMRARERVAVASYSFRSLMDTPRNRVRAGSTELIHLENFAAVIAKRYDVHGGGVAGAALSKQGARLLAGVAGGREGR